MLAANRKLILGLTMEVKSLQLVQFKNYKEASFSFCEGFNCLTGNNGQGKSNVLDALYYMAYCKSYLNPIETQNILHNSDFYLIQAEVKTDNEEQKPDLLSCGFSKGKKKLFKKGKKEYEKLAEHIGFLPLVMISPYDTDLIREGSEVRRKFFDGVIAQYDRTYFSALQDYQKLVKQRNGYLKSTLTTQSFDHGLDEIYRAQMVPLIQQLHKGREAFLSEFVPLFATIYAELSGGNELPNLTFESQLNGCEDLDDLLKRGVEKDKRVGYSSVGSHKDDYVFQLGSFPIKKFGSQGQQKTFLIALKLAKYRYLHLKMNKKPLVLLDDIFDKLDDNRVKQLLALLKGEEFGQVFLTDTDKKRTEKMMKELKVNYQLFHIEAGEVSHV